MVQPLRVGIAGLGTVGAAVIRLIARERSDLAARTGRDILVAGVSARDRTRPRDAAVDAYPWFADPTALAAADIDILVEAIGGEGGVALATIEAAIAAGCGVVTANKALVARHGLRLAAAAEAAGVAFTFEASVAGGIPVIRVLRDGLAGVAVERVYGILNGTCNYILSRMETERLSFAECLGEAQRLGYAEADPTFDIGGFDTAHKLAILTSLAFGTRIDADAVAIEGIESITLADLEAAAELGYRVKLLGVARRTPAGIEQRVHPTMVPKSSPIAQVMGVTNAVTIDGDAVHELTLVGPGAGGEATASAIVADIADLARGARPASFGRPAAALAPLRRAPIQAHEGGYYIRLTLLDRPGAAAAVASRMAEAGISLESIVQRARPGAKPAAIAAVPVVLITHATSEKAIRRALEAVAADGHVAEPPHFIRIEREEGP